MNTSATERSFEGVRRANRWLDYAAALNILRDYFGYTSDEIDAISQKLTGKRLTKTSIWRFLTQHKDAPRALPGISEVALHTMASTQTGIALRSLLAEHAIRQASDNLATFPSEDSREQMNRQLKLAQGELDALKRLLKMLAPPGEGDTERALDLASVDYLQGQISIHKGRLLPKESTREKSREFQAGSVCMKAVFDRLSHALRAGPRHAEPIDIVLAVNAGLNDYFTAYEIDDAANDAGFPRANETARRIATPLFFLAANKSSLWQRDPRVAFNAASVAGLARQPVVAAKSLKLAAQVDGFEGNILDWKPAWILEDLRDSAELADAIALMNRKGV